MFEAVLKAALERQLPPLHPPLSALHFLPPQSVEIPCKWYLPLLTPQWRTAAFLAGNKYYWGARREAGCEPNLLRQRRFSPFKKKARSNFPLPCTVLSTWQESFVEAGASRVRREPWSGCRCLATRSACRQHARLLGSTFVPEKGFELCFHAEKQGRNAAFSSSSLEELGFPNSTSQPKYSVIIICLGSVSCDGFCAFAQGNIELVLFAVAVIVVVA